MSSNHHHLALPGALSAFALLFAVGCSANPDAGSGEQTGATSEAVDLSAYSNDGGTPQIQVVQDGTAAAKATGVVFVPFLDANRAPTFVSSTQYGNLPVRGSCGITFVSPHFAITSSHCFSNTNAPDPTNQTFTAQTFDVSTANVDDFFFDSAMTGTFPNYTPIFGHTMNQAVGYASTTFTCKIASRCAFTGFPAAGAFNCDAVTAPDVTMLQCAARAPRSAWLPIANDAATTGPVVMYWFHELFMTNNNPDMITHYTNLLNGDAANWHYLGAPTNVFLPLKSVPWGNGTPRMRIGAGSDSDVATDLYGCHGTSGSGVLTVSGSSYALLGPVHRGGVWANGHLCDDPGLLTQGAPGGRGLTFNSNTSVNALVNAKFAATLTSDRNPPPVCGDGLCNGKENDVTCSRDCRPGVCAGGLADCCGDGVCRTPAVCSRFLCP
jgi:hypothetical protein